jgi:regulator of sigma D
MLEGCNNARDYWQGVDKVVERWLNDRQEVIRFYCAISSLKSYTNKEVPITVRVRAFCQVLVDYVSAGHFEVYEQLSREAKTFADKHTKVVELLFSAINTTTETALHFNDLYDTDAHCQEMLSLLPRALSELGMALEERFELEDKLINILHDAHRELVA